ncbi:MAG TPA: hypothetical protein VF631_01500 [Allosphingosinicella sp.]|uniref:hypothetical protein n=1 Tax=Allosphingosinicella sp. TaxID=2823234 RepID=UPI002F27953B
MRQLVLAAAIACALPAAASAQSSATFPEEMDEEIVRSLPHPYDVEEAGDRLGSAVGAILNVPIGGVIQAIDPAARAHRNDTVADVAGRDDPFFEERVEDDVRGLTLKTADLMRQLTVVAPVLRRSLADLERNLEGAIRQRPDRDYDDYRR